MLADRIPYIGHLVPPYSTLPKVLNHSIDKATYQNYEEKQYKREKAKKANCSKKGPPQHGNPHIYILRNVPPFKHGGEVKMPLCAHSECRKAFVKRSAHHKFCGQHCRWRTPPQTKKCEQCGDEFKAKRYTTRFCHEKCQRKAYRLKKFPKKPSKPCAYCGGEFLPKKRTHIYCCFRCSMRGLYENSPEYREKQKALARACFRRKVQDPEYVIKTRERQAEWKKNNSDQVRIARRNLLQRRMQDPEFAIKEKERKAAWREKNKERLRLQNREAKRRWRAQRKAQEALPISPP